ncbi:TadE family type IV pilus minor pilin [Brooklawnia sp.]|uniref:TadE family type IV pilus minor pilin n=1 Tax=Brooklawnia sp. TaxID=2699740 RepID=UPI00311DD607
MLRSLATDSVSGLLRQSRQRGMVTVELAVGMLTACLMAGMLGWTVSLVALQARCSDAAGQIARQLARGDQEAAQQAEVHMPDGAALTVLESDARVTVLVAVETHWGALGTVAIEGRASAPSGGR